MYRNIKLIKVSSNYYSKRYQWATYIVCVNVLYLAFRGFQRPSFFREVVEVAKKELERTHLQLCTPQEREQHEVR